MLKILESAWQGLPLAPTTRSWLKAFWAIVRGILYVGIGAAYTYATNYHPTQAAPVIWVGVVMAIEAAVRFAAKYVSAHNPRETYFTDLLEQTVVQAGSAVLQYEHVNAPTDPVQPPPMPSGDTNPALQATAVRPAVNVAQKAQSYPNAYTATPTMSNRPTNVPPRDPWLTDSNPPIVLPQK